MYSTLKELLTQTLANEFSQALHSSLYDKLGADLHRDARISKDIYPNPDIQKTALGQMQHYTIMQTIDTIFKEEAFYTLQTTNPKGAYFPIIQLENIILIPRRSSARERWKKANYLSEFAKYNKPLNQQCELFSLEHFPNEKVLVIMDIHYEGGILYVSYLIPNSNLNSILVHINHTEVLEHFEKPIDQTQTITPIVKLKKVLEQAGDIKIASNQ